MYPPPNHDVGVGGHAPSSQSFQSAASNGEKGSASARKRSQSSVTSSAGSQETQKHGHGTPITFKAPADSAPAKLRSNPYMAQKYPIAEDAAYYLIWEYTGTEGSIFAACFRDASENPPIMPESLAELDMARIINNPKLRHDVNFDRELHFRPNLDGQKGREKMRQAEDYWKALEAELLVYGLVNKRRRDPVEAHNQAYWDDVLRSTPKRLPIVLGAIRDILKTLVPNSDQQGIVSRLDVQLIMQEIQKGMCDLVNLGDWLAKILKNHCAPMRDFLVEVMRVEITEGAMTDNLTRLAKGIRQALTLLEAMKLDVANHQIRHMRPILIADTVNFQQKYNAHRVAVNKVDVPKSRMWLNNERREVPLDDWNQPLSHLRLLPHAVLRHLLDLRIIDFPPTFYLDVDRLRHLQWDLHSLIYLQICRDIFQDMVCQNRVPKHEVLKATKTLDHSVRAIVGQSSTFPDRKKNIATEIMRLVLELEKHDTTYDELTMSLILQRLDNDLIQYSRTWVDISRKLSAKLIPQLQSGMEQYLGLGAVQLQDKLIPQAPARHRQPTLGFGAVLVPPGASGSAAQDSQASNPEDELARRLTHMLVLHWQVWADIAYLVPEPEEGDELAAILGVETPDSIGSNSPTVPVAQAVYAPGRRWLPVGVTVTEVPSQLPTPTPSPGPNSDDLQQPRSTNPDQSDEESEDLPDDLPDSEPERPPY